MNYSACFVGGHDNPKRQVDSTSIAQQSRGSGVNPVHAVIGQTGLAPHQHHISAFQTDRPCPVSPPRAAHSERGRVAKADTENRPAEVFLVLVEMHPHSGIRVVPVHEAAVGSARQTCATRPDIRDRVGDRRPRGSTRMPGRIPVSPVIGDPAETSRRCHANAHLFARWRDGLMQRCSTHDIPDGIAQGLLLTPIQRRFPDSEAHHVERCGKLHEAP